MLTQTKTLAIIPARAGSKGIKNKNLSLLGGNPLLYYTIKAAKDSKNIDEIVVSSDGDNILEYAKTQDVTTLKRPAKLAQDDTTSDKVILHVLEHFKDFSHIILLQPTSPFRNASHIDSAFAKFRRDRANALISVVSCDNKILKAFVLDSNNYLKGICNNSYPFMPRQKLPKTFMSNGAIYIIESKLFLKNPNFLQEKTTYFEMDIESSLDIDTLQDLENANRIIESK
ncbi:acylneuraminate cytidylyltransferase family protein [Helicobacter saguini]|uniref:Acylneuraminate cytidylyltransferase family protein n=1 Tax=Helicobacter saguini TaxID=1548018 RepID=A0A347VTN0_9HELI|nr:NTP transferase domain-containing protein [Helicobacter saguini]MWV62032.1 acylneuraminate cytidylyltransferase family protein [Helicobacter saguini]MWV67295.1 acylneuraminate cytidylyltransferase family protein [Helicobacter saguini]MWV69648.1 acylneuraminate cytidylyltransferase family protein [Helicobacter saguini]MWV70801.1 acylneuraminate cytidylyltransferase family protein [Helicobacter saguini]TLD94358.1 acylneuraminate cytidylyltransferase family protein [Helicobacter saguini]